MSDVQSRPAPARGRGASGRGGRGGHSTRGRGGRGSVSKQGALDTAPVDEDDELGEIKSRYKAEIAMVKEIYPDWADPDIVFALQESDGDLQTTIEGIASGRISNFSEVKKKTKERSQSKQPASTQNASTNDASAAATRSARGRGQSEAPRGRGRASERVRGVARGGRAGRVPSQPKTNGSGSKAAGESATTDHASAGWDNSGTDADASLSSWENVTAEQAQPEEVKPAAKPKSWASMFAKKPDPPPAAPKAAPTHNPPSDPPIPAAIATADTIVPTGDPEVPSTPPTSDLASNGPAQAITPPKDDLTEDNLEKVPDVSRAITATAASTAASTIDQRVVSGTPLGPSSLKLPDRPPMGGYATTAYKATGLPGRSASYQRKILEQQEAVVMPGKSGVDKTAVQFGSMGLNGTPDDLDVDSDREDAETRAQPPQHSPVAPRASLPPAPDQKQEQGLPQPAEAQQAPRQAPGLPAPSQVPPSHQQAPGAGAGAEGSSIPQGYNYNQYTDRYSQQQAAQTDNTPAASKPYEPFGQQLQHSQPYDNYGGQYGGLSNEARQYLESKASSGAGGLSAYYNAEDQNRGYGGYGQPQATSGPESTQAQQRTSSTIGSSAPSQPAHQSTAQARYGQADSQGSGHSTPYSSVPGQQSGNHPHASGPGQQHGGYGYGGYPYGGYYSSYNMNQMGSHSYNRDRPPFDDARRFEQDSYAASYGYGGPGGYGASHYGGAGGKGIYGQQHSYGMNPNSTHDPHSGSPAPGAFSQQLPASGRDSAVGGLSGYGARSGSTQPSDIHHAGGTQASGGPEAFGRSTSGYQSQNQSQGLGAGSNEDSLRAYGADSKGPNGPSPALGQSGRPGSAVNPQTGLPPQDARSYQGAYNFPGQPSQYGAGPGQGGNASGGQNQQGHFGGYGGGYGGNYYGGSNRGGWGQSYGH